MDNKTIIIVFVYSVVIFFHIEFNAASETKHQQAEDPCDTCPQQGKCVPKVSCPAHVRSDSHNPECHLEGGHIGICCYTGHHYAAKPQSKAKGRSHQKKGADLKKAYNSSQTRWNNWRARSQNVLEYPDDTVVSADSPDFGHHLSVVGTDEEANSLGEGGLRNLFAAQELKEQEAFDDEELATGYGETYEGPYCPPQPTCPHPPSPYRSPNGECNNPNHPTWGAGNTGFERLLPPDYSDGIWALRSSKCGDCSEPLPSARDVSAALLLEGHHPSKTLNFMCAQFSQFIAHDVTATEIFKHGNGSAISCCSKEGGHLPPEHLHFACAPIAVCPEDEFFSKFNKTCLNFVRAQLAPSPDCSCGYAKQMNGATHFMDLSHLYGRTEEKQNQLRASGGYLKVFNDYGRELMPLTDRPECRMNGGACFDSGDHHGNQLISLTFLHTVLTRQHNRLAGELRRLNPHWDEHAVFNICKAILVAMYQHIVYNEWLPLIIGPKLMEIYSLGATYNGYATCYDPEVNPSVLVEFGVAALRFGHSTVASKIKVGCPDSEEASEYISVSETMLDPSRMRKRPFMDRLAKGMMSQPMERVDPFVTFGLTRYMFRGGNAFGLDLAAVNIQRGRDLGARAYRHYRHLCGLHTFHSFDDFVSSVRDRLSSVYGCPDDIDLWVGGLLEPPVEGGIVGDTFACIIAEQFFRFKKGDRYYYEYGPEHNPGAFTPSQLAEIKKTTFSRILCDNLDKMEISSIARSAFHRSDLPWNAPVQCDDPSIPSMDMSCFKA